MKIIIILDSGTKDDKTVLDTSIKTFVDTLASVFNKKVTFKTYGRQAPNYDRLVYELTDS